MSPTEFSDNAGSGVLSPAGSLRTTILDPLFGHYTHRDVVYRSEIDIVAGQPCSRAPIRPHAPAVRHGELAARVKSPPAASQKSGSSDMFPSVPA